MYVILKPLVKLTTDCARRYIECDYLCVDGCVCVHIMYRVAVETLWNILPELKVEPDEELATRVSLPSLFTVWRVFFGGGGGGGNIFVVFVVKRRTTKYLPTKNTACARPK